MDSPSSKPPAQETPSRPLSRLGAGTPTPVAKTPRQNVSRPASPATAPASRAPVPDNRPLNVTDALSYLDAVKVQFQDKPEVYNKFLDIMKDFKSQAIDTPGVIQRVSRLFHGNPYLIQGFNTFLPAGYRIDISSDPREPNTIIVTTPSGITTQNTNTISHIPGPRAPHDVPPATSHSGPAIPTTLPPLPGPPASSRAMTPQTFTGPGQPPIPINAPIPSAPFDTMASPGFQNTQTTAAASVLGNLNSKNTPEKQPQGEFNHAIQYLNKIKARFADDTNRDTYKHFLDILQTYQKEQRHLQDSQVYVQVQQLFKDAPDLLAEFKDFLPEAVPPGAGMIPAGSSTSIPQNWNGPDILDKPIKKTTVAVKRKKKVAEKDTTPVPMNKPAPSRAKKPKYQHKPDTGSPTFSPYPIPPSPPPHAGSSSQMHGSASHLDAQISLSSLGQVNTGTENKLLFFDKAKKTLQPQQTYDEFLKLLNLFAKDIIDVRLLIDRARVFLEPDLLAEFKDVVGWDPRLDDVERGPPGSIRTGPPEALSALPAEDGEGPSYRKLPDSEIRLACSGRDELCRSVLNDEWVSHPTWASEEAGFVTHKKNSFEEALNRSEEERHEYHVQIEALTRTISILEPIQNRIDEMTNDERSAFKLKADFGGSGKSIYHRVIKKVYGRESGLEIIQALQDCPSVAVPVVLARLKQKDEEWRRAQREWSRTWREVDAKNYYKSLDHQGISFKVNDKKNITSKHFVSHIESVRAQELAASEDRAVPVFARGSNPGQLEFSFEDTSVLHDSLKMVYSFLDRSTAQYSSQERRSTEKFLRSFIPLLCMFPAAEFNAACGPSDGQDDDPMHVESVQSGRRSTGSAHSGQFNGIAAGDLRRQLLRAAQDRLLGKDQQSVAGSRAATPQFTQHKDVSIQDPWLNETSLASDLPPETDDVPRVFFSNTTFYTLLRLVQVLYSRLLVCKEEGQRLADSKHAHLLSNPVAVELGLEDPNGPSTVLASMKVSGSSDNLNLVYLYLLDACEKVFAGELDQATFEEHTRWFFGTKAYHLFTLDKVITALVKQAQTIISDTKCQELLALLQSAQTSEIITKEDIISYRREAERSVGQDDHLYRVLWMPDTKMIRIQLLRPEDPSIDGVKTRKGRWREYIRTFALEVPTEWRPIPTSDSGNRALVFLRRSRGDNSRPAAVEGKLNVRIVVPSYQLRYENGTEDMIWRREWHEEALVERARNREAERRKFLTQF